MSGFLKVFSFLSGHPYRFQYTFKSFSSLSDNRVYRSLLPLPCSTLISLRLDSICSGFIDTTSLTRNPAEYEVVSIIRFLRLSVASKSFIKSDRLKMVGSFLVCFLLGILKLIFFSFKVVL